MTRNHVVLGKHWNYPLRRLYYDFQEEAFYMDKSDGAGSIFALFKKDVHDLAWAKSLSIPALFLFGLIAYFAQFLFPPILAGGLLAGGLLTASFYKGRALYAQHALSQKVSRGRVFANELECLRAATKAQALSAIPGLLFLLPIAILMFFTREPALFALAWVLLFDYIFFRWAPHRLAQFRKELTAGKIWIDRVYK